MRVLLRHLWVLTTEELYDLLGRKRAVLSLALYIGVLGFSMHWFSRLQQRFEPVTDLVKAGPKLDVLRQQLSGYGLEGTLDFVVELSRYPASLWMFQIFSLLALPAIVGLVSCDMVAMDIDRGTLRFVLQRSSRLAYYLAKCLAHTALFVGLQFISVAGLIVMCAVTNAQFNVGDYLRLGALYFGVAVPFIFFLVASTEWVSSWSRRPMSAIVRLNVLWMVFFVVLGWEPLLSPLTSYSLIGLVLPFDRYLLESAASLLAWGAGFALIGLGGFLRRSV